MKSLFLFLLIITPFFVFAQGRASVDIIGAHEHSYRILDGKNDEICVATILEYRADETPKSNLRLGFNYKRRIFHRLYLKTGIRLASVGVKGPVTESRWPSQNIRTFFSLCSANFQISFTTNI